MTKTITKSQIIAALKKFFFPMSHYKQEGTFVIDLDAIFVMQVGNKAFYWPQEEVLHTVIEEFIKDLFHIECPNVKIELSDYYADGLNYVLIVYWEGK